MLGSLKHPAVLTRAAKSGFLAVLAATLAMTHIEASSQDRIGAPVPAHKPMMRADAGQVVDLSKTFQFFRKAEPVKAVIRTKRLPASAAWRAGLAAWRKSRFEESARSFEDVASADVSDWMAAGGAYWAGRAYEKAGYGRKAQSWFRHAGEYSRTFYGLLAIQALGQDFDFDWRAPVFTKEHKKILAALPAGRRAFALVAAGKPGQAQAELLRLDARSDDTLKGALLAYAAYAHLPQLAYKLGHARRDGDLYDAALYPTIPWEPEGGYTVDPSLLNAIARQESKFNPSAESPRGAIGLMQIMPATANFIARDMRVSGAQSRLKDPRASLALAQSYIRALLRDPNVKGDILKLVVAYNAGPGKLGRWARQYKTNDPLLFIETIPSPETRDYVEKVLANYWIYRLQDGQPAPSLSALADGGRALYAADATDAAFAIASR